MPVPFKIHKGVGGLAGRAALTMGAASGHNNASIRWFMLILRIRRLIERIRNGLHT